MITQDSTITLKISRELNDHVATFCKLKKKSKSGLIKDLLEKKTKFKRKMK